MRNNERSVERGRFTCPSGDPKKIIFNPTLKDDGTIILEPIGVKDTDEEIQAAAEQCALDVLIKRFMQGDESVLQQYKPLYMDLTEIPTNYADILQFAINAETAFNTLPYEIKNKYDDNWRLFAMKAGTDEWMEDLGLKTKPESVKSDSQEVSNDT